MGGTWVHWFQPHVWAEISRYGLEVVESLGTSAPQRILTVRGDEQRWRSYEDAWPELEGLIDRFAGASREVLERPHGPLFRLAHVRALDGRMVQDRIDEMTDLDPAQRDLLNGMWSLCCSASCSAAGYVTMLRWYALSGWDAGLMFDAIARYKIKTGTSSLVEAIAHDSEAEIRLSTAVARIEHNELGATVITRAGDVFESDGVVVTAPLNTLGSISLGPSCRPAALAVEQGQASRGLKVWLDVRGDLPDAFFAIAPEDHAINYVHTEDIVDGRQFLVGFGSTARSSTLRTCNRYSRRQRVFSATSRSFRSPATTGWTRVLTWYVAGVPARPGQRDPLRPTEAGRATVLRRFRDRERMERIHRRRDRVRNASRPPGVADAWPACKRRRGLTAAPLLASLLAPRAASPSSAHERTRQAPVADSSCGLLTQGRFPPSASTRGAHAAGRVGAVARPDRPWSSRLCLRMRGLLDAGAQIVQRHAPATRAAHAAFCRGTRW